MAYPEFIVAIPMIAPREVTAAARRHLNMDSPDIFVIDNTANGEYEEGPWRYYSERRNLGVAASWNKALELGCDLTIILSSYLELDDGLATTVDRIREAANEYGCVTWAAMHCFAITKKTVEVVGLFDEFFRMAYF